MLTKSLVSAESPDLALKKTKNDFLVSPYSHLQFAPSILFLRRRALVHLDTAGREAFNLYLQSVSAFALLFCYFYKRFSWFVAGGSKRLTTRMYSCKIPPPIPFSTPCFTTGTTPAPPWLQQPCLDWKGRSQLTCVPTLPLTSSFTPQPLPAAKSFPFPSQLARLFGELIILMKEHKNIWLFI